MRASLGIGVSCGIVALALSLSPRAEVIDPSVATSVDIGSGACERGPARDGRAASLPRQPKVKWAQQLDNALQYAPVIDAKGAVIVVGSASELLELAPNDGVKKSVKIGKMDADIIASSPVILASGTRVVMTLGGVAIGITPAGSIAFRTRVPTEIGAAQKTGMVPVPSGGFVVSRRGDLVELDAHGNIVDRVRLELGAGLAVRATGEVVGIGPGAELWGWRAGRVARQLGTFGDKGAAVPRCQGEGVIIDTRKSSERAVCVSDRRVESIDLATGQKIALLDVDATPGKRPFRTAGALSRSGEISTVLAGGALYGLSVQGNDFGPFEVPGASAPMAGKDGGVVYSSALGEVAPIVASDGAVAWGSTDGVAIERGGMVTRVTRCGGYGSLPAWLASTPGGGIVVACPEGRVELWGDSP